MIFPKLCIKMAGQRLGYMIKNGEEKKRRWTTEGEKLSQLRCCSKCPSMRKIESFPLWQQTENEPHDQRLAVDFFYLGFWCRSIRMQPYWGSQWPLKAIITLLACMSQTFLGTVPWEALLQEPGFLGWPFYHMKIKRDGVLPTTASVAPSSWGRI